MKHLRTYSLLLLMLFGMVACTMVEPRSADNASESQPASALEESVDQPQLAEGTDAPQPAEGTAVPKAAAAGDDTADKPIVPQATPAAKAPASYDSDTVKLGYHYRPPSDDTKASKLADKVSFIVLSKNDEDYRDRIRKAGYEGPILQYIMANEVDGPPDTQPGDWCDDDHNPWQNQVANKVGEFCDLIHPNEDWFLHNGKGERLYGMNEDRYFYRMNPASEGWREFAVERLKEYLHGNEKVEPLGYDGFFFDNVELSMRKSLNEVGNSDGKLKEYRSEREFRKAWQGWLRFMRNRLGSDTPLWANLITPNHTADDWNDYLPYLDGVMNEAFVTGYDWPLNSKAQTNELKQVEYALSQGKGVYAVSQGKEDDTSKQKFALASYLLVMQPDAPNYFRYTRSSGKYDEWWSYDNYDVKLGQPLGPRYAIKNGWRRDFSNGYVTVDQKSRKGKIVQNDR